MCRVAEWLSSVPPGGFFSNLSTRIMGFSPKYPPSLAPEYNSQILNTCYLSLKGSEKQDKKDKKSKKSRGIKAGIKGREVCNE